MTHPLGLLLGAASFPSPAKRHLVSDWLHTCCRWWLLVLCLLLCSSYALAQSAPTITSVNPSSGPVSGGNSVTITGTNLTGTTGVTFGGTPATSFTFISATSITATSPSHAAGPVDVVVTTPGGSSATSANSKYTYTPLTLSINNATVLEGNTGDSTMTFTVTLSEVSGSTVTVNYATSNGTATAGSDYIAASGTLTFPPGDTSKTISVTIVGDTQVEPNETFTINLFNPIPSVVTLGTASGTGTIQNDDVAAPTVTGVNPNSGTIAGGTSVTLTGTNFTGATAVTIGGTTATGITVVNATTITATAQAHAAGPVDVVVTTPGGTATLTNAYTYAAPPVATESNATVAHGSSNNNITLSITGGAATSVAVGTQATHGIATASGATISYTPTASYSGLDSFTYTATNAGGTSSPATVTVTVSDPTISVSPSSVPNATVGTSYPAQTVSASGGSSPYTYTITSGSLPAGMTLASSGTLSGTPTAGGTFNFTVTATDSSTGAGPFTGSKALSLTVGAPTISVSPTTLPNPSYGVAYSQTVSASGGIAPYAFAVTAGSLPAGLILNPGTGLISGTPTVSSPYLFTITATDSSTGTGPYTGSRTYTGAVGAPTITVSPVSLPNPSYGVAYSQTVSASGGTGPYTYTVSAGSLPTGLTLSSGGVVSGTPTGSGAYSFTIKVVDTNGATGTNAYSLQVQAAAPTAPPVAVNTGANQPVTINATANATGAPFTGVAVHTQPASGTVVVQGMNLVYTPAASTQGDISFTYTLANAGGTSAPIAVTVQVAARPDPTTDATVRGITTSQQQAAVRFAGTQLMNFTQRLEHLRNPQRSTFTNGLQLAMPRAVNTQVRNCRSATSLLEQQECISNQGRMERGSLAPGWSRAAQHNAAAASQGLNTERAFASGAQVLGQDVPPSDVGGAASANRAFTAAQQLMGKAAPELAQMTALPAVDTPIAEPGSAARPRLAYWTSGMVDWGFADATAGQDDGLRFTTSGVTMGMDYLLSKEWTVGMGIGFAYDRTKIGSEGSRNHSKGVSTALYGSWSPAPAYFVDGVVGYSRMSFDTRRWVADAGEFAQGERDGSQWFAALSAGYEWRTEQWMLSPYGRLQFARSSLDAYTETGAGWHALHFEKQSITNTSASLGLRGEVSHETRWGTLLPFGRLELQHDFDHQSDVRLGYADLMGTSQSYSISSTTLGRNRVQLGFGSRLQSRVGTFAAEMQFTRSSHSFQRGLRLMYTTRW